MSRNLFAERSDDGTAAPWRLCRRRASSRSRAYREAATTAPRHAIPKTPWRYVMEIARAATRATEIARETVPGARPALVDSEHRYWDRVVEIGLAGATAEFRPPERLG
jgi:hypothetical protein